MAEVGHNSSDTFMSLLTILLFVGTMGLSLWATMRVRQVYSRFSQLPAASGVSGAEAAASILRQEGIYDVEIVEHFQWSLMPPEGRNSP